jgi:hypothetical protein
MAEQRFVERSERTVELSRASFSLVSQTVESYNVCYTDFTILVDMLRLTPRSDATGDATQQNAVGDGDNNVARHNAEQASLDEDEGIQTDFAVSTSDLRQESGPSSSASAAHGHGEPLSQKSEAVVTDGELQRKVVRVDGAVDDGVARLDIVISQRFVKKVCVAKQYVSRVAVSCPEEHLFTSKLHVVPDLRLFSKRVKTDLHLPLRHAPVQQSPSTQEAALCISTPPGSVQAASSRVVRVRPHEKASLVKQDTTVSHSAQSKKAPATRVSSRQEVTFSHADMDEIPDVKDEVASPGTDSEQNFKTKLGLRILQRRGLDSSQQQQLAHTKLEFRIFQPFVHHVVDTRSEDSSVDDVTTLSSGDWDSALPTSDDFDSRLMSDSGDLHSTTLVSEDSAVMTGDELDSIMQMSEVDDLDATISDSAVDLNSDRLKQSINLLTPEQDSFGDFDFLSAESLDGAPEVETAARGAPSSGDTSMRVLPPQATGIVEMRLGSSSVDPTPRTTVQQAVSSTVDSFLFVSTEPTDSGSGTRLAQSFHLVSPGSSFEDGDTQQARGLESSSSSGETLEGRTNPQDASDAGGQKASASLPTEKTSWGSFFGSAATALRSLFSTSNKQDDLRYTEEPETSAVSDEQQNDVHSFDEKSWTTVKDDLSSVNDGQNQEQHSDSSSNALWSQSQDAVDSRDQSWSAQPLPTVEASSTSGWYVTAFVSGAPAVRMTKTAADGADARRDTTFEDQPDSSVDPVRSGSGTSSAKQEDVADTAVADTTSNSVDPSTVHFPTVRGSPDGDGATGEEDAEEVTIGGDVGHYLSGDEDAASWWSRFLIWLKKVH